MARLTDLEKSIRDLNDKVNNLIITRTYEQKDLEALDKKVELLEKSVTQNTFVIKLQTFLAAAIVTAGITALLKLL
jgi:hypothetical protein